MSKVIRSKVKFSRGRGGEGRGGEGILIKNSNSRQEPTN